jgi:hypothetical protein
MPGKIRRTGRRSSRITLPVASAILVGALLILILLTPALTRWASRARTDWAQLADVGQSYGGISAMLSALALAAIAVSLFLQRRQSQIALISAARDRHFELVRFAIEHPVLSAMVDPSISHDEFSVQAYANLTVAHWQMIWDLGMVDDDHLVAEAADLFTDPTAREWWARFGPNWTATRTRQHRAFQALITAGHEQARNRRPPAVQARTGSSRRTGTAMMTAAVVAGAIAAGVARRRRRRGVAGRATGPARR